MLENGSLCVMAGLTQSAYKHGVPEVKGDVPDEPRLNMTFRKVIPGFKFPEA